MFIFGTLYYHHSSQMTSSMEGREQEAASSRRSNDGPEKARSHAVSVFVIHLAWWPTNFGNFSKTTIALALGMEAFSLHQSLSAINTPSFEAKSTCFRGERVNLSLSKVEVIVFKSQTNFNMQLS